MYIRDSELLHSLLGIESFDTLLGHPIFGASWEGVVIENILGQLKPTVNASFYRTAKGEDMDLVMEYGERKIAIECKASKSPDVTRSMVIAINDLQPDHVFVVAPVSDSYPLSKSITVTPLKDLFAQPAVADFLHG